DAARGEKILLGERGVICLTCHQSGSQGRNFGPSFDGIGSRRTKENLLDSLLNPSNEIETAYVNYTVTTLDDRTFTGFITHHDRIGVVLRDAGLQESMIAVEEISTMTDSDASIMPAGLAQAFSEQDLSDLLAYLINQHD
ncbi:MAG: hypothetical protein ACKVHP_26290, partial [Verrucomicrobiales bacterium]